MDDIQNKIFGRLHRIEGQARGVENMIRDHKGTPQVIQQLEAIRSATNQLISLLIEDKFSDTTKITPDDLAYLKRFIKRL